MMNLVFIFALMGFSFGVFGFIGFIYSVILWRRVEQLKIEVRRLRHSAEHPGLPASPDRHWPMLEQNAYALGVQELPSSIHSEIRELLDDGKKVSAIKRLREETGMGIKEAKDYVDRL